MSDGSDIEWLKGPNGERPASHNVVVGCTYRSRGCLNCYALRQARMREFNPNPKVAAAFAGTTVHPEGGDLAWSGQVNLLPERLEMPLHWDLPRFIFVNSMGEMFDDSVPEEFIAEEFAIIGLTPSHTYMLLTKCHARMRAVLTSERFRKLYTTAYRRRARQLGASSPKWRDRLRGRMMNAPWPLMNLRLGVSAEDQETAERRIPALLACRTVAGVLWVSAEPLVGRIDLRNLKIRNGALIDALHGDVKDPRDGVIYAAAPGALDWVVAGGESGPGSTPMHPAWARSLRDQCQQTQTAFFFKQRGSWTWNLGGPLRYREPGLYVHEDGRIADEATALADGGSWTGAWRVGKHAAGRQLDGREWNEHPPVWGLAA